MTNLANLIAEGRVVARTPWPRSIADRSVWELAIAELEAGRSTLLALWGEAACVHLALFEETTQFIGVFSFECLDGRFPSVAARHAPAQRLERTIVDLFGLVPDGATDARVWLDHGRWGVRHPLGAAGAPVEQAAYAFLPVEGEDLHQIAVGPVHAGIIEPGHFRFTASGETIVRLEERLGYVHKGIEGLLGGASIERGARLAGRVSGDSTIAYSIAFAQAVEAALDMRPPQRALWLRALMLELERIANHLGDIGAICNDAAFSLMQAHCAVLRERTLRTADSTFGHRLMMDRVVPGGVAGDLDQNGKRKLGAFVRVVRRRLLALVTLYDETASLQDRTVGTGIAAPELVRRFGAGGFIGRASGRKFDVRRTLPFTPYEQLSFEVPVSAEGDVDARVRIRLAEVEQSLCLIEQILAKLPEGLVIAPLPLRAGEGIGLVEGFRGDIFVWVRLNGDGTIARCHLRDPSWFQWPLLETAIDGNIVADFPLCNKSFNCSYSGHDL